jgi:hypothetical protein
LCRNNDWFEEVYKMSYYLNENAEWFPGDQYFHITSVGNRMWDSSEFEESNAEYFLSSKAAFNISLVQILPPTYIISFAMETKQPYPHDTILAGYSVQIANFGYYCKQEMFNNKRGIRKREVSSLNSESSFYI